MHSSIQKDKGLKVLECESRSTQVIFSVDGNQGQYPDKKNRSVRPSLVLDNESVQMEMSMAFLYLNGEWMSINERKSLHCSNLEGHR